MDMSSPICNLEFFLTSKARILYWNYQQLNVVIHPSLNTFTMGNFNINCNRETRRISCMIVDFDKMDKIIVKQSRNKKDPSDVCLISLQLAEDLASVKSDFED